MAECEIRMRASRGSGAGRGVLGRQARSSRGKIVSRFDSRANTIDADEYDRVMRTYHTFYRRSTEHISLSTVHSLASLVYLS